MLEKRFALTLTLIWVWFCHPNGFGYNVTDSTIYAHLRATAKLLSKEAILWRVTHDFPQGNIPPMEYQLISVLNPAAPIQLFVIGTQFQFQIHIRHDGSKRVLSISELNLKTSNSENNQKFRSATPLGTFEFLSDFSKHNQILSKILNGNSTSEFSGSLKIMNGYPTWIFGANASENWIFEMKRNMFFPSAIRWTGTFHHESIWEYEYTQEYVPWGIQSAELTQILFTQKKSNNPTPVLKTEWKMTRVFKSNLDWKQFLNTHQKSQNPSGNETTLDTDLLKAILISY